MTPIPLSPVDLALASSLLVADGALSVLLGMGLHWRLAFAGGRMVVQLVLVGYVLRLVFAAGSPGLTLALVAAMALVATREVASRPGTRLARCGNYLVAGAAVGVSTGLTATLALDTVLRGVSADRQAIEGQLALGVPYAEAVRPIVREAARVGLLPVVNQMSAAGVITLPGIMTGQILAGLGPLEAVKYQILLMFLLAGSSGLAAVLTAVLAVRCLTDDRERLRLDLLAGR